MNKIKIETSALRVLCAASKDQSRYNLLGFHTKRLGTTQTRIESTNGHWLAVTTSNEATELPDDTIFRAESKLGKSKGEIREFTKTPDYNLFLASDGIQGELSIVQSEYPDTASLVKDIPVPTHRIVVNAAYLRSICELALKNGDKNNALALEFSKEPGSPIVFNAIAGNFYGIIMPMRDEKTVGVGDATDKLKRLY